MAKKITQPNDWLLVQWLEIVRSCGCHIAAPGTISLREGTIYIENWRLDFGNGVDMFAMSRELVARARARNLM